MADGLVQSRTEGTPQGGPLSPLLSNILLTEWTGNSNERYLHPISLAHPTSSAPRLGRP